MFADADLVAIVSEPGSLYYESGFHYEPVVNFNWDEIEPEPDPETDYSKAAEQLHDLLLYIWKGGVADLEKVKLRFEIFKSEVQTGDSLALRGLATLLQWCNSRPHDKRACFAKFTAMSMTIDPRLCEGKTFDEVGRLLGVTKAALNKHSRNFVIRFGVKFRRTRPADGIAHMRQARLRQRDDKGHVIGRHRAGSSTGPVAEKPTIS